MPQLVAALLLLASSAWLAHAAPSLGPSRGDAHPSGGETRAVGDAARDEEPLARALQPLGPVRALISSALWVRLLHDQMSGDSDEAAALARALLTLHPALSTVREYLAGQLLVTEAPRAPDRARHDALVATGLTLFEEGLLLPGGERLHAPFGRTLAVQTMVDGLFAPAAERVLGEMPEERALRELLASGPQGFDRWLAANLALERGLLAWQLDGDRAAASRDLELARSLLPRSDADAVASGAASPGADADEIMERAAALLAPLQEALQSGQRPSRQSPSDQPPSDQPAGELPPR